MLISRKDSEIGFVQCYSNISRTLLGAIGHQFYSLHLTLRNFLEDERRKQLMSSRMVLAYFPTELHINEKLDDFPNPLQMHYMKMLRRAIEFIPNPL